MVHDHHINRARREGRKRQVSSSYDLSSGKSALFQTNYDSSSFSRATWFPLLCVEKSTRHIAALDGMFSVETWRKQSDGSNADQLICIHIESPSTGVPKRIVCM
jgi:hypothetical protein